MRHRDPHTAYRRRSHLLVGGALLALALHGCDGGTDDSPSRGGSLDDGSVPSGTGESPPSAPSGAPSPDSPTPTPTPMPMPEIGEPADAARATISGRTVRAVSADRGPVVGVPNAAMDLTSRPEVHPAGFLAYSGLYRLGESDFHYAAWGGPIDDPALIIDEDSPVEGLTPSVRFRLAQQLRVASDGSVGMIAALKGARETTAVIEWEAGSTRLLAESGRAVDTRRSEHRVLAIEAISRSTAGSLFATLNEDSSVTFWSNGSGSLEPVIGNPDSGVATVPRIENCYVTAGDLSRSDLVSGPVLLDSGAIVFPALLVDFPGQSVCDDAEAVVRYEDGSLATAVRQNDPVPNAPEWRFGRVLLGDVLSNGDVVVRGRLDNQGVGQVWSLWIFPVDGPPRLIALEREELELVSGVDRLVGVAGLEPDLAGADRVVIRATFGEAPVETALLGGAPPFGQPHAALEAPGASALALLVSSGTAIPPPFGEASYFGAIDRPAIDRNGRVAFYGSVFDASLDARVEDAVWQVSPDGELTRLLVETDIVQVGTRRVEALSLVSGPLGRAPDAFYMDVLDDGGLIIYGRSEGPFELGRAILHLEP